MNRDLEKTCWDVFDAIGTDPAEEVDRRLKALELLVKIRSAGQKVKVDSPDDASGEKKGLLDQVRRVQQSLNS